MLDDGSRIRSLESGVWNLESGVWNLESGIWNLESGIWNLESGIWNLESGVRHLTPQTPHPRNKKAPSYLRALSLLCDVSRLTSYVLRFTSYGFTLSSS